jgi:hypothetical protein
MSINTYIDQLAWSPTAKLYKTDTQSSTSPPECGYKSEHPTVNFCMITAKHIMLNTSTQAWLLKTEA